MEQRINIGKAEPEAYRALSALDRYLATTQLIQTHKDLIRISASLINGCAYCIDLHTREARENGETEQRIYLLRVWREVDIYSEEERAVLALTEEVTLIGNHVSAGTYANAARLFDEHYLAALIMTIIAINAWNRIGIATQMKPLARRPGV